MEVARRNGVIVAVDNEFKCIQRARLTLDMATLKYATVPISRSAAKYCRKSKGSSSTSSSSRLVVVVVVGAPRTSEYDRPPTLLRSRCLPPIRPAYTLGLAWDLNLIELLHAVFIEKFDEFDPFGFYGGREGLRNKGGFVIMVFLDFKVIFMDSLLKGCIIRREMVEGRELEEGEAEQQQKQQQQEQQRA
ncbi:hypothetical protein HZH68_016281 [Vespula germanica]|uniref:Uncharacterized protein n=1 Tax=Vespula germanica TaxID=30212 RepID=A0A834J7F8_VESGE|nr:hypothetical protein HZH68_016281 [Vespula germanica]